MDSRGQSKNEESAGFFWGGVTGNPGLAVLIEEQGGKGGKIPKATSQLVEGQINFLYYSKLGGRNSETV